MKRLIFLAGAAIAMLALPVLALAQPAHPDSPKATLVMPQALVVGTTTLQPGQYKFQCRTFDGKTFLVVTSTENGKEITRVPCVREMLDAKVTESEFRSSARTDGTRQLTSVRIKGEAAAHRVLN